MYNISVCAFVCVFEYISIHTGKTSYIHTAYSKERCLNIYIPTYIHTYTQHFIHTYRPHHGRRLVHTHADIHTCMHAYIHEYIHTYIHTDIPPTPQLET